MSVEIVSAKLLLAHQPNAGWRWRVSSTIILHFSPVELCHCVEHCNDVFRRNFGGDIVYLCEDKPAAGRENLQPFEYV